VVEELLIVLQEDQVEQEAVDQEVDQDQDHQEQLVLLILEEEEAEVNLKDLR
jgi:hypothetical protein